MICDINTASCEIIQEEQPSKVRMIYFTDPICSACWGIEPQLRKLQLEYGDHINIEYRMGGLLKSWQSYGGNDVSGPASVAEHWDEAARHYQMPIDGDVWLEDPLQSSYPASIAFKAAQLQDEQKAKHFLRRLREMVFAEKKNISKGGYLLQAAEDSQLNTRQFLADYAHRATALFEQDLDVARQWGVKGFPTIFLTDENGSRLKLYGSKTYEQYEAAILQLLPGITKKALPENDVLFRSFNTLAEKEFAVIRNINLKDATDTLERLYAGKVLHKLPSKHGNLWKIA